MIVIENRKKNLEKLNDEYPGATILDVTSKSEDEWVCLSPFFPHGNIPVPFTPWKTSESVEGIWQGLKVFERAGVDVKKMNETGMNGLKRSTRTFGKVKGHQKGLDSEELLGYIEARKQIYIPTYEWVLKNRCNLLIDRIVKMSREGVVVLLDYDTNPDIEDPSSPLSHASLILRYASSLMTKEEIDLWPAQEKEILKLRKEVKARRKKEEAEKIARWEKAACEGNPSQYTPLWLRSLKKEKKNIDYLFFWSQFGPKNTITKACFSQWYPCEFVVDGIQYNCASQYMIAEKARLFGDEESLAKVMAMSADMESEMTNVDKEIKVTDSSVWNEQKFGIVVKGNMAKFSQNERLKKFLVGTGSRVLAEANPIDRVWGIGMRESDKEIEDPEKWYGINLLGFALMVVRDNLRTQ